MLFVIDTEFSSAVQGRDNDAIRVINDLCTSVKYGRHSLFAEREVLHSMKENVYLNMDSRGIASHLLENYAIRYGDVLSHIKFWIRLSCGTSAPLINWMRGGYCEFVIPIAYINDDVFFRESVLLLENSAEASFYMRLARNYASEIGYRASVSFDSDLGGGNTTSGEFKKYIDSQRICLCICDSDVTHPGAYMGDTYTKCACVENNNWPLCKVTSTFPFREVENLIPIPYFKHISLSDGNIRDFYRDWCLVTKYNKSISLFLDFKKGLNYWGLYKMEECSRTYLLRSLFQSGLLSEEQLIEIDSSTEDELKIKGGTIIIHGCGTSILASYLKNSENLQLSDLSEDQKRVCLYLGSLVYNWGFCYGRIVI